MTTHPPDPDPSAPRAAGRHLSPVPVALGPSGLSDYAVSPLATSAALLGEGVRVAFLGRTSTED